METRNNIPVIYLLKHMASSCRKSQQISNVRFVKVFRYQLMHKTYQHTRNGKVDVEKAHNEETAGIQLGTMGIA